MHILSIETSCDETAVAYVEAKGSLKGKALPEFKILSSIVLTQIPLHRKYGGVYPSLAKREHAKNLLPVCIEALKKAKEYRKNAKPISFSNDIKKELQKIFIREPELLDHFLKIIPSLKQPNIDAIAVTVGPGLEPALWVGINFSKALSLVWNVPVIPTNHMEGHAVSALLSLKKTKGYQKFENISYPAILLLVSGGHTELVLIQKPLQYSLLGATRDDAAGEAFDKTARILGLPYPGGPEISRLATHFPGTPSFSLPRPMIGSKNLDFSYSGLKTAVLYTWQKVTRKTLKKKSEMAKEIENAIAETLVAKTLQALHEKNAKTLILGGGVTANNTIQEKFKKRSEEEGFKLLIPAPILTTDNALMIALAGYLRAQDNPRNIKKSWKEVKNLKANGSLDIT